MCTGSNVDTDKCEDMLNDYRCNCKAGYIGKNCTVSFYNVALI